MSLCRRVARIGRWLGVLLLGVPLSEGRALGWAPSCEPAERYTLKNGVEVVLVVSSSLPAVAIVSSVHVGTRHDPQGYQGLAHYVEHLTFRGAPPFASAFDLYEEIGANALNATTSPDSTDYFAVVPSSQLERALWIEARRLGLGLASLSEEAAADERRVILREHELRFGWQPGYAVRRATDEALFPAGHPYHSLLASEDSIEQLTLQDARSFFARWYRPERTRLVLVGDFEPKAARAMVDKYFGALRAETDAGPSADECGWAKTTPKPARQRIVLRSVYRGERLELYWPMQAGEDPDAVSGVFDLLRSELSVAMRQTGLGHQVSAVLLPRELNSYWSIAIDVSRGQPFDNVEPLVARVVSNLRSSFTSDLELTAWRQALELEDQSLHGQLLARAQYLARRQCQPAVCVEPTKLLSASAVNPLDRFAPERALIVERRYAVGASEDGDLEMLP